MGVGGKEKMLKGKTAEPLFTGQRKKKKKRKGETPGKKKMGATHKSLRRM